MESDRPTYASKVLLFFQMFWVCSCVVLSPQVQAHELEQNPAFFIGPVQHSIKPHWMKKNAASDSAVDRIHIGERAPLIVVTELAPDLTLPEVLRTEPFDHDKQNQIQQSYQDLRRPYNLKEASGTIRLEERAQLIQDQAGIASGLFNHFRESNWSRIREGVIQKARALVPTRRAERLVHVVPVPIRVIVGVGGALLTGTGLDIPVAPQLSVRTQIDLPKQRSEFNLRSPIVDTHLSLRGLQQGQIDPNSPPPVDFPAKNYRVEVGVSKSIPSLKLSGGVSYVNTTEALRASFSHELAPHLVAEISTTQPLNAANRLQPREEAFRIQYGFSF